MHLQRRGAEKRRDQIGALLERMEAEKRGVIMGDPNCLWWQEPRQMIEDRGYISVFKHLQRYRPRTVPTKAYRHMLNRKERLAVAVTRGFAVDDIYVKNVDVVDADVFVGESDHAGVWATLQR